MKKLYFIIIIFVLSIFSISSDEYARTMNSYDNKITPESLHGKSTDELMFVDEFDVKNTHSSINTVKVTIRYEKVFHQIRIIYQCDYKLYDGFDAYTSTRDCLIDFMNEHNYKHYQDIKIPEESHRKIELNGKTKYVSQYMRYVKMYN